VDQAVAQRRAAIGARNAAVGARNAAVAARNAAIAARDGLPSGTPAAERRRLNAQIDQAAGQIAQANGQISQASGNIDAATAGINAAKAQRTGAQAAQRIAEAGLDAARADEARATLAVDQAQLALDELTVKAPIGGTLVTMAPRVGDRIGPGVVVARIADVSGWRFETSDLSETSIARVREGAGATITVDGLPGTEIAGTVESVGGYGAPSQGDIVFRVVVAPSGAVPEGLRWNMTVTLEIDGVGAGS
jgi:multidrug resistance efflux pump